MKRVAIGGHLSFFLATFVVLSLGVAGYVVRAADATPPIISDIRIEEVGNDSATISWTTNDKSDSQVNFGLNNDYGIIRDPVADKNVHKITLPNLEPASTYHFRAVSSDEYGNQTISGDFTVTTDGVVPLSDIKDVVVKEDQQNLAAKALAIIDQITDPEALILITEQVQEVAERVIAPPTIIGTPQIIEVGETYAVIGWKTDRESTSLVSFVSEDQYDPESSDPYTSTQGDTQDHVINHEIEIIGLKPAVTYHFRVFSEDILSLEGKSPDTVFMTTSPLPTIRDLRITKVEETSATFSWSTTVPAAGYVVYMNKKTGQVKTEGSPELISGHTVRITDLTLGTKYSAHVNTENAAGDKVTSDEMTFVTVKDEFPPDISKVSNESTLYPSSDSKIQTIVSWATDEEAYCQFYYRQGLTAQSEDLTLDREKEPRTDHVQVVVAFLPATVYKFWVACEDGAGNASRSEDFVLFTPAKEKSIIDIILENFQGAFGWVKNIGK